jgi:ribonucleoside-diphosphate reductase alpha chain
MGGTKLFELHPIFETELQARGIYSKELLSRITKQGTIKELTGIPEDLKKLFVTSFDVKPEQHLRIQASFQKHTDNSVSKTINLPHDATADDVRKIYFAAHDLKCKGITIYRYGSKANQVLSFGAESEEKDEDSLTAPVTEDGCSSGYCNL